MFKTYKLKDHNLSNILGKITTHGFYSSTLYNTHNNPHKILNQKIPQSKIALLKITIIFFHSKKIKNKSKSFKSSANLSKIIILIPKINKINTISNSNQCKIKISNKTKSIQTKINKITNQLLKFLISWYLRHNPNKILNPLINWSYKK